MTELLTAAVETAQVDVGRRTIAGLAVPFGKAGRTSTGALSFAAGDLTWSDPRRVKLLREHSQHDSLGYAVELGERPEGIWARFYVPPGTDGDAALAEAADGRRDGLSVGVQIDDATADRLRRAAGRPGAVRGAGQLREVSLVSVPAFDDARVADVAASNRALVVSAWTDPDPHPSTTGEQVTDTTTTTPPSDDPGQPATTPAVPVTPADPRTPERPPAEPTTTTDDPNDRPAIVRASAGMAAYVGGEPSIYTFDGAGPSLVRDAFTAQVDGDADARDRVMRYNAQLVDGNAPSELALAAVAKIDDLPGGSGGPFVPQVARPMLGALNARRPLVSRLNTVRISNAQPFLVPVEGEFVGVADHVEGTAHVVEGTLSLADEAIRPRATSGAYRISRELVDSSNPAIDRIAVGAMVRDYARYCELKVAAALILGAGPAIASVNTVMELRAALIDFVSDDEEVADFVAASRTFLTPLLTEVDGQDRPMLTTNPNVAAAGSVRAGYTGVTIDGVEVARAPRLAAGDAFIVQADAVLWAESGAQTFRFEQPEGPGILKLALWAYTAAYVLRPTRVRRLTTAA